MKLHVAKEIAVQVRMFMNGWTWGMAGPLAPSRRVREAERILRRHYRARLEDETHVMQDGKLLMLNSAGQPAGHVPSKDSGVAYPPPGCSGRWNCAACRKAGMVFKCKSCKRQRPWCIGATDRHPGCCDICRCRRHRSLKPRAVFRQG
jgi:hypothetical protein